MEPLSPQSMEPFSLSPQSRGSLAAPAPSLQVEIPGCWSSPHPHHWLGPPHGPLKGVSQEHRSHLRPQLLQLQWRQGLPQEEGRSTGPGHSRAGAGKSSRGRPRGGCQAGQGPGVEDKVAPAVWTCHPPPHLRPGQGLALSSQGTPRRVCSGLMWPELPFKGHAGFRVDRAPAGWWVCPGGAGREPGPTRGRAGGEPGPARGS